MTREFDREASEEAHKLVDQRIPMPNETPGGAAFKAVVMSGIVVVVANVLSTYIGRDWAMAVTVALAGLVAWFDCRDAYNSRSRLYREEYELFAERNERNRVAQAERERQRSERS